MTTLVWDGKTLASDSQMTVGFNQISPETVQKVFKIDTGTYRGERVLGVGVAGDAGSVIEFIDWIKASGKLPDSKESCNSPVDNIHAIIVTEKNIYEQCFSESPRKVNDVLAIGSGYNFAISALVMGKSATEAVHHAIKLDAFSGGEVQVLNCR